MKKIIIIINLEQKNFMLKWKYIDTRLELHLVLIS